MTILINTGTVIFIQLNFGVIESKFQLDRNKREI